MQLTPQQNGWLKMAEIKANLFKELESHELMVQNLLATPGSLESLQAAIKRAKDTISEAKERRLSFTRMLDEKLYEPAMAYEKRMNQLLDEASKKELDLRIEAKNQSIISQNILNEKAAFKVHVTNEWYRIAEEYRENLRKGIDAFYRESLQNKTPYSDKLVCECQMFISAFLPSQIAKFQPQYLTPTEMEVIFYGIQKYDYEIDLEKALDHVPARFQNYENDLANSEAAIQAIIDAANRRESEVIKAIAIETATNTLIAQAETVTIETPKVKTEMKVVIVESEAWAKAVIMNFIKIWPADKLRVKSWSKLTLSQMAEALAKSGAELTNLELTEVCK